MTVSPWTARFIQAITGVRDALPECSAADPFSACNKPSKECLAECSVPDLGVHDDHIYLFEPCVIRNLFDYSLHVSRAVAARSYSCHYLI